MQPVLFDSSVYISAFRRGTALSLSLAGIPAKTSLWLSAVVLEELYAGATGRAFDLVMGLEREFKKEDMLLVPNANDWAKAGRVLASLAAKYDYEEIGRGRLTNDALIATSAGRLGVLVITVNGQDFRKLAEFCSFQWQLTV
jgi:predicted nucleic acid-binding protein